MNSEYNKAFVIQPFSNVLAITLPTFKYLSKVFYLSHVERKHSKEQNVFLQLHLIFGLCHLVLTTPKTCPEALILAVVKMQ